MEIKNDKFYTVRFGTGYIYLHNNGGCRGSKRSGSIVSGKKLMKLPFNIHLALESGIISLEEIED